MLAITFKFSPFHPYELVYMCVALLLLQFKLYKKKIQHSTLSALQIGDGLVVLILQILWHIHLLKLNQPLWQQSQETPSSRLKCLVQTPARVFCLLSSPKVRVNLNT